MAPTLEDEDSASSGMPSPPHSSGVKPILSFQKLLNFGLDPLEPRLICFRNSVNQPLANSMHIIELTYPRRVFIDVASYSKFVEVADTVAQTEHSSWPTMAEQEHNQEYSVRIYIKFVSTFQALDDVHHFHTMLQTVINNNLEDRIKVLERAASTSSTSLVDIPNRWLPICVVPTTQQCSYGTIP